MIYVSSVKALNQELPWEPEIFTYLQSFLIDIFRREVLCDAAVIGVAQLYLVVFMVKQVVNIHIVYITLYVL
jgi:hypothetical protein